MSDLICFVPMRSLNAASVLHSLNPYLLGKANSKGRLMDLSPIRKNFEKNRNRQKFHNSLKENPMFSKIAKFGCEML